MANNSRVPSTIALFNKYIENTDNKLQSVNAATSNFYYVDYGIDAASAAAWHSKRQDWDNVVYPAYVNPLTSTSIVKADLHKFISAFQQFASPLLHKIAVSGIAGNEEEQVFNFVLRRKHPARAVAAVAHRCIAAIQPMGTGMYRIACKGTHTAGRPAKCMAQTACSMLLSSPRSRLCPSPTPTTTL